MILNLFLLHIFLIDFVLCLTKQSLQLSQPTKINLDCDVRPFNDLHLLNYFLKQQLKQTPLTNDDLAKKFYEFRDTVDLNQLENDCEKKSNPKFALIKHGKNYQLDPSSSNKKSNRKKISQRMSLELVNALLLGKLLGLNLGMLSSVIFANVFRPNGLTTPSPGGGGSGGGSGSGGGGADGGGGGDSGGGGGGGGDAGDAGGGGGDGGGGDGGGRRFISGNYDDNFAGRFDREEYCDDHERLNESPVDAADYGDQDWKYNSKRKGYKRRHKRDLFSSSSKSRSKKSFPNPIEDNEDLLNFNSGASVYIPTTIDRLNLGLSDNTALHNHKLSVDLPKTNFKNSKKFNQFPSYSGHSINALNNVPFIAPSSFDFSKIPVLHNIAPANNRPKIGPNFSNTYPIYDTNLDPLSNERNDYFDFGNDKKEEIDLDYKWKAAKGPEYFDDELDNEFKDDFDLPKPTQRTKVQKKNYHPKRNDGSKNKKTFKKKIDFDKLEREDDVEPRTVDSRRNLDTKGQKLIRVTRQITVYNKNLFEDSFLRDTDEEAMLDSNDDGVSSEMTSSQLDQNEKELKNPSLSKLRRRKKNRKKKSKKSKTNSSKKKRRTKNGLKSPASRGRNKNNGGGVKGGRGKKMKSRSLNLISSSERNNSSVYTNENSWFI